MCTYSVLYKTEYVHITSFLEGRVNVRVLEGILICVISTALKKSKN